MNVECKYLCVERCELGEWSRYGVGEASDCGCSGTVRNWWVRSFGVSRGGVES
jgi:hypothetical protein